MGKEGERVVCVCFNVRYRLQNKRTEKEKKKVCELRHHHSTASLGNVGGCFDDKAVYFHKLSVLDLHLVPQSHGLDLGKQCVCVCVYLHLSAHIISKLMVLSHSWYVVLQFLIHPVFYRPYIAHRGMNSHVYANKC